MQFVHRSSCPELLEEKQADWTAPWLVYYRWKTGMNCETKKVTRPSSSHWLRDEIRLPLIKDFHNNCGYCGQSLPTPQNTSVSKGDVDHYLPQSDYPDQVYEWTNYVWSCKPCNGLKWTFHSTEHPLLNPCCKKDCTQLLFIEDTGQYILKPAVANDTYWQQRLNNNERKTCLNADEICQKRCVGISMLRQRFESIAGTIDNIAMLRKRDSGGRLGTAIKRMKGQLCSDIEEILIITGSPEFYFLLQEQYRRLRQKYRKVAELIDQQEETSQPSQS